MAFDPTADTRKKVGRLLGVQPVARSRDLQELGLRKMDVNLRDPILGHMLRTTAIDEQTSSGKYIIFKSLRPTYEIRHAVLEHSEIEPPAGAAVLDHEVLQEEGTKVRVGHSTGQD